jgi:predicted CoA-binding protein
MGLIAVLGASPNPERFSYKAVKLLVRHGNQVVPLGKRKGTIGDLAIVTGQPVLTDVDTVLIYLAPGHQGEIFDYVLSLRPKRVVFNPGTESPEFEEILESYGIKVIKDCSLVMIASGRF